ncbi:MAG: hypothetical protein RLZZ292_2666 [Bacteroidota bacterium]|jgi:gliding motility-associated-like protein
MLKTYTTRLFLLVNILFFTILNLHAQIDICVRVQNDSMIVAYKAKTDYLTPPSNFWNSQTVTVRYPKTATLNWGGITQLSTFFWEQDMQTVGAGKDGGDGYWYKSFYSSNTPAENFKKGAFKDVFKIKITTTQPVVIEGLNNAVTQLYHLDAAANNATEPGKNWDGNVFAAYINGCSTVASPPPPPNDLDGDSYSGKDDPDDTNPCIPSNQSPTCDFDKDGVVNAIDTDDDNDGVGDATDPNPFESKDTDGDGLKDDFETVITKTNPLLGDTDSDSIGDGLEWNGADNNHATSNDNSNPLDPCSPTKVVITEVKAIKPSSCVVKDAQLTVTANGGNNLTYSIDNGKTFVTNPFFHNLEVATYQVVVKNGVGCQSIYANATKITCDSCSDKLPPVFTFTNSIAKNKKFGDTLVTYCGNEQILLEGKDFFVTDNQTKKLNVTFHEVLLANTKTCDKGFLLQLHCTWQAIDECGNIGGADFYMVVKDTLAPTLLNIPNNITITDKEPVPNPPLVTAKDLCSKDSISVNFVQNISDSLIVRIWTAADPCGNLRTYKQSIHITKSVIVVPPPVPPAAPPVTSDLMEIRLTVGEYKNMIVSSNDFSTLDHVAILQADSANAEVAKVELNDTERKLLNIVGEKAGIRKMMLGRYNAAHECDTLLLHIIIEESLDTIHVFSAFSPNDDAINDFFTIKNIELFKPNVLTLYNRFGNQVYTAKDYQNDWNGTFKEQKLPDGTYFYVLELPNKVVRKGYIQLER